MFFRSLVCLILIAACKQVLAAPFPQDGSGSGPEQAPTPSITSTDTEPQSSEPSVPPPAGLTGEVISDIPLSCIAGCSLSQTLYE